MSQATDFQFKKATITIGEEQFDFRELIMDFQWYESIESPLIRCDISILDSIQFDSTLRGNEKIRLQFNTYAAAISKDIRSEKVDIDHILQIYKIGSIIKDERTKVYILHCISPEMYMNESQRAFGSYGPVSGNPEIVESMVNEYLSASEKIQHEDAIEDYSYINVISPNWRPIDLISYISDKVVRRQSMKRDQSGFLFYENRLGFNFHSIDYLCEQEPIERYIYKQNNIHVQNPTNSAYQIKSIKYPDRLNHLEKMRMGTYKTCTYGVVIDALTESYIPNPGVSNSNLLDDVTNYRVPSSQQFNSSISEEQFSEVLENNPNIGPFSQSQRQVQIAEKTSKSSGTISGPIQLTLKDYFDRASTIEKDFPFDETVLQYEERYPTRTKIKFLPKYKNQMVNDPSGGAENSSVNYLSLIHISEPTRPY